MEELKKLPPLSPVEEPPNRLNTKIRRKQQLQQQQQQTPVSRISQNFVTFDHNVVSFEADGEEEEQKFDQGETGSKQQR